MNDKDPINSQKLEKLKEVLNEMKFKANLGGILFANRNGDIIAYNIKEISEIEKMSSMCASVLESAEEMGKILNDKQINKIIAELDDKAIMLIKCNDKTFLTLIIENFSKIELKTKNKTYPAGKDINQRP